MQLECQIKWLLKTCGDANFSGGKESFQIDRKIKTELRLQYVLPMKKMWDGRSQWPKHRF